MEALAADAMEGRETGSPGLARAERYIVERLKRAGLQPAGENDSCYQKVRFESRYEAIVRDLMVAVADETRGPEWKADSFFRRFAEPKP